MMLAMVSVGVRLFEGYYLCCSFNWVHITDTN